MKQPFIFAALAATWFGATPVQAQNIAADLLPPYEVATIVTSMGMRPLDRPIWRDGRYIVHAIDRHGREVRVVLDAQDGQVLAVRPRVRDYVYEPRYAPPPPPGYGRPAPYDPRFEAPPPPASVPGRPRPPLDDDDEFFDNDRRQGSLMPPGNPSRVAPVPRESTTGSISRQATSDAPSERKDAAAPLPRPRPALANAAPADPQTTGSAGAGDKSAPAPEKKASQAEPKAASNAQTPRTDTAKKDVRIIDMSKPKPAAPKEEQPGEAIRF